MQDEPVSDTFDDFRVLTTAAEAWPTFEDAVFNAQSEVIGGFRIFDLTTGLRNPRVREVVGPQWIDLLAHVLKKGVRVDLTLCDFDPVMGTDLHRLTWRSMRQAAALAEIVGAELAQNLSIRAHLHPARAGIVPRAVLTPIVEAKRKAAKEKMNEAELAREAPGLSQADQDFRTTTHHQKLAVIDADHLYIGGLDLNERRWDTPEHDQPASQSWSDLQVILRGAPAREARQHLMEFRDVVSGGKDPTPLTHIARTLSAPRAVQAPFLSPRTILKEIEDLHLDGFAAAQHLIYIETQYLRSEPIAKGLAGAARNNPDINLIVVMPALPDDVAFEDDAGMDAKFGMEREDNAFEIISDAFKDRAIFAVPVQPRSVAKIGDDSLSGSPLIHVHNKLLVIDDTLACIGSANLNGRSMRWDTEVALRIKDPVNVDQVRRASRHHWWRKGTVPSQYHDVQMQFEWWAQEIRRNQVRLPENRLGLLVPFDHEARKGRGVGLPGVTENLV